MGRLDNITKGLGMMVIGYYSIILVWILLIKPHDTISATAVIMPVVLGFAQISGVSLGIWVMLRPWVLPSLRKLWPAL